MSLLALVTPNQIVHRIWDLDPEALARAGMRGLILDLDNTLTEWNRPRLVEGVGEWLAGARRAGLALCIASNARGERRVKALAEEIGAHYLVRAGKPRRGAYLRAAERMGTSPQQTAVIGDQIFTDVLGGNRAGMRTILVRPFSRRDFPATKVMRVLEWFLLRVLASRGLRPQGGSPRKQVPEG